MNGDLHNQGLDGLVNASVQTGVAVDNNGKIGKCYTNSGTTAPVANNVNLSSDSFSVCAWVKINTLRKGWQTSVKMFGSGTYLGLGCEHTDGVRLGFHFYKTVDGTNKGVFDVYPCIPQVGTWVHYTMTYDGTKYYIYENGTLKVNRDVNLPNTPVEMTSLYLFGTNTSYSLHSLNDVRIYDHALSPREVKEISKGLVCHYTLSGLGENLYTGSKDFSGTWGGAGGWSTSVDSYLGFTVKQRNAIWGGLSQNIPCTNGDIFTISFYAKVDSGGNIQSVHRSSLGNVTTGLELLEGNFSSGNIWVNNTDDGTSWKRYWATVQITSSDITYLQWRIENSVRDKNMYICGLKLEKGSVATPWTPNPADPEYTEMGFDDGIEYDVSGYGYNGTKTGTITYDTDTPRYWTSTYFNGSSYISTEAGSFGWFDFDQCTISAWMKPTSKPSSYSGAIGLSHDYTNNNKQFSIANHAGIFVAYYNNGSYSNVSSGYELPLNEWHHCVAVLDGTTVKLYVDGILKKTQTIDWGSAAVASTGRIQVGVDFPGSDEKYAGYYSDARIYMTPLSEADILALYNTPISLTSNGTLLTQGELTEV